MESQPTTRGNKAGLPPGTLSFVGERRAAEPSILIADYGPEHYEEFESTEVDDCGTFAERSSHSWIHVTGLHRIGIIEKLGRCVRVPALILEDILNTEHRPKVELFDGGLFAVFKFFSLDAAGIKLEVEQVSFVLGQGYLLTFQESDRPLFEPIRRRLKNPRSRMRQSGTDYLFYSLMDLVVDHYFIVLEDLGERIEDLEEELLEDMREDLLKDIHRIRRQCLFMRKSVVPLREVVGLLWREEESLIGPVTQPFLRDLYDHVIQVLDTLENYRELAAALLDVYLSTLSNRLNQVMKVLTIIATIFIPITFIAGVYGMNFKDMPELEWPWAYPVVWLVMVGVGAGMITFFKRKRWL